MTTKENKTKIIWLSVLALIIIVGIIVYAVIHRSKMYTIQNPAPTPGSSMSDQQNAPTNTGANTPPVTNNTKEYEAALVKYKNQRMQFSNCQATPNNMTFKNPATLMLDNRSKTADKIVIDGKTYDVPGYGFKVITLNETKLPARSYVDCNTSQNVATLLIEK